MARSAYETIIDTLRAMRGYPAPKQIPIGIVTAINPDGTYEVGISGTYSNMAKFQGQSMTMNINGKSIKVGDFVMRDDIEPEEISTPVKPPTSLSAYDILGVAPSASNDEIKSAYRRQVKLCHPDVAGDSRREEFEDLQRAYKLLSDPKSRKKYDAIRKLEEKSKQQANDYEGTHNPFGGGNSPYAYSGSATFNAQMYGNWGNSASAYAANVTFTSRNRYNTQSYLQNAFQVSTSLPAHILSMQIHRTTNAYSLNQDEIEIIESGANSIRPGEEYFINNLPVGVVLKTNIYGHRNAHTTTEITLIL